MATLASPPMLPSQTELGRYLYFQFAPTLVYRDVYPRSGNRVKWLTAGYHAFNFLGTVVYTYLVFRTLVVPQFRETAKNPGDHVIFIKSVFRSMLPGMLTLLLLFFGVLHSWFNLFAELLRFGDRRFYSDWWNARTWSDFYRKWNSVVHEWLYYYVYLDAMRLSLGRISRGTAWALVFVFSAIIHEQILSCGLGMCVTHPSSLVVAAKYPFTPLFSLLARLLLPCPTHHVWRPGCVFHVFGQTWASGHEYADVVYAHDWHRPAAGAVCQGVVRTLSLQRLISGECVPCWNTRCLYPSSLTPSALFPDSCMRVATCWWTSSRAPGCHTSNWICSNSSMAIEHHGCSH